MPSTSVSTISLLAPSAWASAAAAWSALRFNASPSVSLPTEAITGMNPPPARRCTISGWTAVICPTRPNPGGWRSGAAARRRPSRPERPTALPPALVIRPTSVLFARPERTISTTSSVSSSVTRRPSTKRGVCPSRSSRREISGPPPWTRTGLTPAPASSTRSSMTVPETRVRMLPPYLMTTVRPRQALTYWSPRAISAPSAAISAARAFNSVPPVFVSRHVPAVQPDIGFGEVAGPAAPAPRAQTQIDLDGKLGGVHRLCGGRHALAVPHPALHQMHAANGDGHARRIDFRTRPPHRGQDPPPVGLHPVGCGLHQRRGGDRLAGAPRVLVTGGPADGDRDHFGRPFAVPHDLVGQVLGQGHQRVLKFRES